MDSLSRKIRFQKKVKEFLTAFAFLSPNFFGFLLITVFPVVAVFFLAMTKWDGITYASPAEGTVIFSLSKPAEQDVYIPKGEVIKGNVEVKKNFTARLNKNAYEQGVFVVPSLGEETLLSIDVRSKGDFEFSQGSIFEVEIPIADESGNVFQVIAKFQTSAPFEVSEQNTQFEIPGKFIEVVSGEYKQGAKINAQEVRIKTVYSRFIEFTGITTETAFIQKGSNQTMYPVKVVSTKTGKIYNIPESVVLSIEGRPDVTAVSATPFVNGKDGIIFVGFENFVGIAKDREFWRYLINTFIFMLEVPLGMLVAIILALALNQKLKGIVVFRTLYFLPYISNLVAIAMLWRWIYNDQGLLNGILVSLGVTNPPSWLGHGDWAKVAIIIMDVWKNVGYTMLVYLAALQQIPSFLYESADIDGANAIQKFAFVTWPLLGPTNFFIIIIGIINGFQAFGSQYVLTGGGPAGATKTIVYYIYNNAFQWFKMGYAAALSVVLFFMMMIFTIIQWKLGQEASQSSW